MNKKSKFDLYLSAVTFAATILDDPDNGHAASLKAHTAFADAGNDEKDWSYWDVTVRQQRNLMRNLRTQPADSVRIAQAAAAAAAAKPQ